jgi:HD domain-containing protein
VASSASDVRRLTKALAFAAEAHRNHRRKGASQEPYINHLIEVLDLVASVEADDMDVLVAALLHDVLEDTRTGYDDLIVTFGERVARIVQENSDDMTLPKPDRQRARLAAMSKKSREARLVKFADVISNLRAIAVSPPAGWSNDRRLGYLNSCRNLADAGRDSNVEIELIFDDTARAVEQAIRTEDLGDIDGGASARRELEAAIGQSVHLVYVPNTRCRSLGEDDIELFCQTIARTFPSATVQMAEGIYESRRRPVLIGRIRTDSTDAVVDLAQRLCIIFDEPIVGIEIDGRYVRIYGDDTA